MARTKSMLWQWLYLMASPKFFHHRGGQLGYIALYSSLCLYALGCSWGLWLAPTDFQQGDAFRIMYVHVPAAISSMIAYLTATFLAVLVLVWRIKLAGIVMRHVIVIGAFLTAMTLFSGAIWGKPTWGAWWVWDARLTSELILEFIYLGLIALGNAIDEPEHAMRLVAIVVCIGFADLPIIHFSVNWWQTLHQGQSLVLLGPSHIDTTMRYPLLIMIVAYGLFFIGHTLLRARDDVLWQQKNSAWVWRLLYASDTAEVG